MKLENYLKLYQNKMGFLETIFLKNVYFKDYGEKGLDLIQPEININRNDGSGRKWRIDFVVKTEKNKFAIETDGFNYHAPGRVSRERFDELTSKDNELVRQGYQRIHLTRDQIENNPDDAIFELRRSLNCDHKMCSLFLRWSNQNIPSPHDVQKIVLAKLNETRTNNKTRGLVSLATGLGKTYLGIFDTLQVKSKRILFIVHQDHILKQAKNSFEKVIPKRIKEMGFFTGNEKFTTYKNASSINIVFASIQTLNKEKNLVKFRSGEFDYIIMDESHHTAAPSYKKVMEYFKPKFFLGLTATPERMDKKNVLEFYENNLVFKMDQNEAIKQGYLSKLNYKGMVDNVDYSDITYNGFRYDVQDLNKKLIIKERDIAILKSFKTLAHNKKTIAFCASIEHAEHCKKFFEKSGYKAECIHSENKSKLVNNKNPIERFENNQFQIAFVVDMLNEGIDIPDVECILMLRPTESRTILKQQLGRGLRLSPKTNKKELLVLDFIGNYKSSPEILAAIGISSNDLKYDKEKDLYFYDNNGQRVEFKEETVDIFKYLESNLTKEVNLKYIDEEWKDYGQFIKNNSETGKNLYWSVGKKNNDLSIHLFVLTKVYENLNKFKTSSDLDKFIRETTKKNFPKKTMEGNRALFFSKLLGIIDEKKPIGFTKNGKKLIDFYKKRDELNTKKLITYQYEKLIFWNDLFSLTDRHSGRRTVNNVFNLFPIFFIYQVILELEKYGYDLNISKFEIENFCYFQGKQSDYIDATNKIIQYRNNENKYELEKYLNSKNRMDSRMYNTLNHIYYFNFGKKNLSINKTFINEIRQKVKIFQELVNKDKIKFFNKEFSTKYKKLLFSEKSLIEYYKN